ncbi:unnamed protein product [Brassicogethes aeneus]|uniref:EGF-like domain-containing protein n=1 Tax=Brassicogethes aeneus TaxID=1431903 RepID=A0A9P0BBX1_BRAAE|nr:unnamed protein product [Brassicogethes aeneus]
MDQTSNGKVTHITKEPIKRRRLRVGDPDFEPPDGGWGWFVIFACGFSNCCIFPMFQQFGLIFREKFEYLGITTTQTTTIINLNLAFNACVGSGIGITQAANCLALNTYFKKRRRIATGLSWTTTGLGPIVWPYIITYLKEPYGMEGTLMIFSAFSLHGFMCALMLHPVEWHTKYRDVDKDPEAAKLLVGGDDMDPRPLSKAKSKSRSIFSSQVIYSNDDPVYQGCEIHDTGTPNILKGNEWYSQNISQVGSRVSLSSNKMSKPNSTMPSKRPSYNNLFDARSKKTSNVNLSVDGKRERKRSVNRAPIREDIEETFKQDNNYLQVYASEKDVLKTAAKKLAEYKEEEDKKQTEVIEDGKPRTTWEKIVDVFDLTLLKDPVFLNLMIGIIIANFAELNFSILTPMVLKQFKFFEYQTATYMSLLGAMDLVVRFLAPFAAEKLDWSNKVFFLIGVMSMALGRVVHTQTYGVGLFTAALIGAGKGLRTVFMALIVPQYVPIQRLPAATGLHLATSGILFIAIGPVVVVLFINIYAEKINWDTLKNYSGFLNFGEKSNKLNKDGLENAIFKSKIDILGEIFKKNIDDLKKNNKLDLIFLVDASSSVGDKNFKSELKFVKKLLSDITVDYNHTRIAVVTFSSSNNINVNIDEISQPSKDHNKCLLLNTQLGNIDYKGGDTYTLGAFKAAQTIFKNGHRNNTKQALFLITDGYSNGGDPVPLAEDLKDQQIQIYTIGIENGNYKELYDLSSSPGERYSYLLDSFEEFESLARRALHVDLKNGDYVPLGVSNPCDGLCTGGDCCDVNALCSCGTTTGHYKCICKLGYYGSGLQNECFPCSDSMYSDGPNTCFPCPDINHVTAVPAVGLESCKCKLGYENTKDYRCQPIKCPKIQIPQHGILVKKRECGNVLNSACGIRCEVGYTLVGKSIRLCQGNATWSGKTPSCEIKVCKTLPPPKNGSMECSHSDLELSDEVNDLPVDTTCTFTCGKGFNLKGSIERTCLPWARWDGLVTLCKPIKCSKLSSIKFATFEPNSCSLGKQDYGKNCTVICREGFKLKGPSDRVCKGKQGVWSRKMEDTVCIGTQIVRAGLLPCDYVTPPKLECPQNLTITSLPGKKYGFASWKEPNITDNSHMDVTIWMKPIFKNVSTFKFQIGETAVKYFAQDAFQNKANCTFYVTVKDDEKPTIENCIDPPIFFSDDKSGLNITWEDPYIFDNSQHVIIQSSHKFGFFPIGTTTVTYNATDDSNNSNICKINITIEEAICKPLPDPIFGYTNCTTQPNGLLCNISCSQGYEIPDESNSTTFSCDDSEPLKFYEVRNNMPECSITKVPEMSNQTGEFDINMDDDACNNNTEITNNVVVFQLKNDIFNTLSNNLCEKDCDIDLKYNCEDEQEKREEQSNIIKRDVKNFEYVPHRNRYRKKLNVKFQVRGKYIYEKNDTQITLANGQNGVLKLDKTEFLCPLGFVPRKNRCVQCPKGSFHNRTSSKCQSCPIGSYNDKLGQTLCIPCPMYHSTRKLRTKSMSECREMCPPGTFARRRIIRHKHKGQNVTLERGSLHPHCRSCKVGLYQEDYGQLHCKACPKGYTTTGYRSTNVDQCIVTAEEVCTSIKDICNNGSCVLTNEYQYGCNCFEGYYGGFCEKKITPCESSPCLNKGSCEEVNVTDFTCKCPLGYSGKYCQDFEVPCKLSCLHGGTCVESDENDFVCLCPEGFYGEFCEIPLKHCNENLCQNNSTCVEEKSTFKCICSRGFLGKRCTILPCDYQPCSTNTVCVNIMEPNASRSSFRYGSNFTLFIDLCNVKFRCLCPDGYTGENCTEKIDYCSENPCKNNGTCISETYTNTCECNKLFYGKFCEFKRETNYILEFTKYDTNNFIKMRGFTNNIREISACLWMQSQDNFNYGTLISYATSQKDNTFTLTDYTGLILYINNQYIVTDLVLNNGHWHHICASWSSINGTYKVYLDGKVVKSGENLSPNTVIPGYGSLVIGQDQDTFGGSFSQSEAYMGKMTYVDIWSRFLTNEEVLSHMNDCQNKNYGDLYAWAEILENVKGNIKVVNSSFCKGCNDPVPLYHGYINIVDNKSFYSCYEGYKLRNDFYKNGRHCTKLGMWEGIHEPHCTKVYCGFPGYTQNSNSIGKNYYFNDEVTYKCYPGFSLSGNSTITCKSDGKWYPNVPKCIGKQCPELSAPELGSLIYISEPNGDDRENNTGVEAGTQVEFICEKNTELYGENILTCLQNGNWDFETPNCSVPLTPQKIDCAILSIPPAPLNAYIDPDSLSEVENGTSDTIFYQCRVGFKIIGSNSSVCIVDGYWSEMNATCESIKCGKPTIPFKMQLKYKEEDKAIYEYGNKITFGCKKGYKLVGNDTIRCQEDTTWSTNLGECQILVSIAVNSLNLSPENGFIKRVNGNIDKRSASIGSSSDQNNNNNDNRASTTTKKPIVKSKMKRTGGGGRRRKG